MHNVKVENVRKVACNLSADQWQLYTFKFERGEIESVANFLNVAFNDLVNCQYSKEDTRDIMLDKLNAFKKYGANDSEPRYVLEQLLKYVYDE